MAETIRDSPDNHHDSLRVQSSIRRSPNLATQVYEALCASITNGSLRPSERIVLDRIAEQLGVSHTPVREALGRLVQEGLIVGESTNRLQVVPLTPQYVHHTYYVRGALEGLAAELATPLITEPTLVAIRSLIMEIESSIDHSDHDVFIKNDTQLHELLWDAADNPVLKRELDGLRMHVNFIRGYSLRHSGDHIRQGHGEHMELLAYLSEGRSDGARKAMEAHIRNTSQRIIQLIEFDAIRPSRLA